MINFNNIIENAFQDKVDILEEIKCGLKCETYLVKIKDKKYIFQIYIGEAIYQAQKKYNILKQFDNKFIPKAIKVEENKKYAYLIMEYMEGEILSYYRKTDPKFSLNYISNNLAKVLGHIHNISNGNEFGWIYDKYNDTFIDYINYEYNRLSTNFDYIDIDIRASILIKVKKAMEIIKNKSKNINKSCLCWYDMNPSNILISKKENEYRLEALIDPGGARYGIPEWDIAFVKTQICINKEEFDDFLANYKKANNTTIDTELVNALSVIVELDVISIEIVNGITFLPIPYDTNFRKEIEAIHKKIKEE